MSTGFLLSMTAVVAVVLCARLLLGGLPMANLARRLPAGDAVLTGIGLLGLLFHCSAMFYTGLVNAIPGAQGPTDAVNALGTASIAWYVVPAVFVLAGLRRLHWSGLVAVGITLSAVGVTMYDSGPLNVHLGAIFAAVVALAVVAAALVLPPTGAFGKSLPARAR